LRHIESHMGGERELVVARELTKLYEEFVRGTVTELIQHFERQAPRGEIVLLVGPASEAAVELIDQQIFDCLASPAMQALPPSARAKAVANMLGIAKSRAYALITGKA